MRALLIAIAISFPGLLVLAGSDLRGAGESVAESFGSSSERDALMDLFHSTAGESWTDNTGWGSSTSYCKWKGITCSWFGLGGVKSIILIKNNLQGTLPASLSKLSGLNAIDLSDNFLTGTLPPEWGVLKQLESVRLVGLLGRRIEERSGLTGGIPDSWKGMRSLYWLFLNLNNLSGPVPSWLGDMPKLTELAIADNSFTGPIPASIGKSKILNLTIGGNPFNTPIPSWLFTMPALQSLVANHCGFTGTIPTDVPEKNVIGTVMLSNNELEGPIPESMCKMTAVDMIDLNVNPKINGAIPDCFTQLSKLTTMWLGNTGLNDSILPGGPKDQLFSRLQYCSLMNDPLKCPISDGLKQKCYASCVE